MKDPKLLEFTRVFSQEGLTPFQLIDWTKTDIILRDKHGQVIYECLGAEFPMAWSPNACTIVAAKYFRVSRNSNDRETSVKQLVSRIVTTIGKYGKAHEYFDEKNGKIFEDELTLILVNQMGFFNSPVLFNCGVPGVEKPVCSACFINSVEDNMESILDLAKAEGLVFKEGSGSGVNFSKLRGSKETIRGGGTASGPVSFMGGYDAFANIILSGGRTRRAARMCILDIDHPDIEKFINVKSEQEDIVAILAKGGMPVDFEDEYNAYAVVKHQSGNNSVRVTDEFMCKVKNILHSYKTDDNWNLKNRADKSLAQTVSVKGLFEKIAAAAWKCGDPGMQFHDLINKMNTCANDGTIHASNPCLTGDMLLKTTDGQQRFDTLARIGTAAIYSPDGNAEIGKVWCSGEKPIVRIRFNSRAQLPDIRCTPDHIWKLSDGTISRADELKHKRLMPDYCVRNPPSNDATLAGFIQGDGQTGRLDSPPHKGLEITFSAADYEIAALFEPQGHSQKLYSNLAYDIAEKYHLDPRVLPERELPEIPEEEESDFLCGLYSANGCVLKNARVTLKTSCSTLRDQVLSLLKKHGIRAYYTTNKAHKVKFSNGTYLCKESYDVNIHHFPSLLIFAKEISFLQTYKRTLLEQLILQRAPAVESVKPDGVDLVYDFEEPKTHWGIINGFIAHNCGEFSWLENSACNLSSINLDKFAQDDRSFNIKNFKHVIRTLVIAQDIIVSMAGYPTKKIEENSNKYRPLGLGYANLGGLLMSWGLPYDSQPARDLAASITSLMTAQAYYTSTEIAEALGPFEAFDRNKEPMEAVLDAHYSKSRALAKDVAGISSKAVSTWQEALSRGFGKRKSQEDGKGFRNAQVTLLAPTGTIAFAMDCATTGVEPDVGLLKTKTMVGGTSITYINPNIEKALKHLNYDAPTCEKLMAYVRANGHFEGSDLKPEHLPVFDCALPIKTRMISIDGHLDMIAAIQPFLSGAISKTFNLPNSATVKDFELTFLKAWEKGIKGVAIYRQGSKLSEPMRVKELLKETTGKPELIRERLPDERRQLGYKFTIGGHTGYITVGFFDDDRIGELFIRMAKHGSTVSGLLDAFATSCSIALQYGIPLEVFIEKFKGSKFTPSGWTQHPEIKLADSIIDFVFRWLDYKFVKKVDSFIEETVVQEYRSRQSMIPTPHELDENDIDLSADPCPKCGAQLRRTGSCSACERCGFNQGVCS